MADQFDVVVIGGGPGGYAAALYGAAAGLNVCMIERDKVGGTCLHRGCIPAKELLESAHVYRTVAHAADFGVEASAPTMQLATTMARKQQVIDGLWKGLEGLLKSRKVTVLAGTGRYRGGGTVQVGLNDGSSQTVEGRAVILASGSRVYGAVDEAQAAMGMARSEADDGSELDAMLVQLERDLYVCMAELATAPDNHGKLTAGQTLVTAEMVAALEPMIDDLIARFPMPKDFVIPGSTRAGAALDLARTIVRRAERESIGVAVDGSHVIAYLNRLSDLLWAMARWQEAGSPTLLAKEIT